MLVRTFVKYIYEQKKRTYRKERICTVDGILEDRTDGMPGQKQLKALHL